MLGLKSCFALFVLRYYPSSIGDNPWKKRGGEREVRGKWLLTLEEPDVVSVKIESC